MDSQLRNYLTRPKRWLRAWLPKLIALLVAFVVGVGTIYGIASGHSAKLDEHQLRTWFWIRGEVEPPDSVVVVAIDRRAYEAAGTPQREVFPRRLLADGLRVIAATGAEMVLFDMVFLDPSQEVEVDQDFARALAMAPSVIGRYVEEDLELLPDGSRELHRRHVMPINILADAASLVINLELYAPKNLATKIAPDGHLPMLDALRRILGREFAKPGRNDLLNCYGGTHSAPVLSFARLIDSTKPVDPNWFRDKVVLIGQALEADVGIVPKDTFHIACSDTPVYGVNIHATIAANLFDESWKRRLLPEVEAIASGVLVTALVIVLFRLPGAIMALVGIAAPIALLAGSYAAFLGADYFVPVYAKALAILIVVSLRGGLLATHYYRKWREVWGS